MNTFPRSIILLSLLPGTIAVFPSQAYAGPSTSPSALSAAKLKHHPPRGWINHYLPDDRYKIKGGVWKFVSTESDEYYYRPDSPYMLSQPAGSVIGFASVTDAEEAGYRPGAGVTAQDRRSVSGNFRSSGSNVSIPNVSSNGTLSIPVSQIPPHILRFIRLVDGYADRIESTSSQRALLQISRELTKLRNDLEDGLAASVWGNRRIPGNVSSMIGVIRTLQNAADTKRNPGGAGIGSSIYLQITANARSEARALIPQVRQAEQRRFYQKAMEYERYQENKAKGR